MQDQKVSDEIGLVIVTFIFGALFGAAVLTLLQEALI